MLAPELFFNLISYIREEESLSEGFEILGIHMPMQSKLLGKWKPLLHLQDEAQQKPWLNANA